MSAHHDSAELVEVLVVGAGQAGLAMSAHLPRPGSRTECSSAAERWRSQRWDSLVANGPAWHDRFPTRLNSSIDSAAVSVTADHDTPAFRSLSSGLRWQYSVARCTPSTRAISTIDCPLARIACAAETFSGVSAIGRPPVRPRARAAVRPARVRSRMISRSNSARAPDRRNCNRPAGVVGRSARSVTETRCRVRPAARPDRLGA